ncbi:MAG: ABC-F family ATP-binding cassette domain-containing protein [Planctomycetota bacterium]|jgi:ATP-binding cassette subfamily F protein uup
MPLVLAENLSKTYAHRPLFEGVRLVIDEGERVGLIGPNGSGKSTLLKILCGLEEADEGEVTKSGSTRMAYVAQQDEFGAGATVLEAASEAVDNDPGDPHEHEIAAQVALSKVGFEDFDQPVSELSGGWRKRLAIARQMAREPDLLMLDEPTNHLDLEGVRWLEDYLGTLGSKVSVVVITHDRHFLENVCGRVVELSRAYPDGVFSVDGPYTKFLERKTDFLDAQHKLEKAFAGKVREDIAFMRQGVKARRTRNQSRVREVEANVTQLRELQSRNRALGAAGVEFAGTDRKTRKLLDAKRIGKTFGDRCLFKDLDVLLSPGYCLGLVGANGSGKTTLIRLLTGELKSDGGSIRRADDLKIVTYTQNRESLDPKIILHEALCPIGDTVRYRGRALHVASWAQRFLFDKQQLRVPVGDLSGGEQARIQLANLMLKDADVLVLDEPTNDLDIPTLEVLEESIASFPGAVVLVTHDRFLLARVSTEVLYLDGAGKWQYFADYDQMVDRLAEEEAAKKAAEQEARKASASNGGAADVGGGGQSMGKGGGPPKLTYKEQMDLDAMEESIAAAEAELEAAQDRANEAAAMTDHAKAQEIYETMAAAQTKVDELYAYWEALEAKDTAYRAR